MSNIRVMTLMLLDAIVAVTGVSRSYIIATRRYLANNTYIRNNAITMMTINLINLSRSMAIQCRPNRVIYIALKMVS